MNVNVNSLSAASFLNVIFSDFVFLGLFSSIFLPPITFSGVSVFLVTLVSPALFLLVVSILVYRPVLHKSSIFPLLLGFLVVLSALVSWARGISLPMSSDLLESIKYFQFFPYLFALSILSVNRLQQMRRWILLSALVTLFVGYIQVFQPSLLLNFILIQYLGSESVHLDSVLSGHRITLTGTDPNVGAIIALFYIVYFIASFMRYKTFSSLLLALLFFYLLFSTQSRTAILAFFFSFGVYFIFFYKLVFWHKFILLLLIVSATVTLIFYMDLQYIILGFQYTLEGRNQSLNVRLDTIMVAIERFQLSPIIGMGPAKSEFYTIIDSEYALILQRYGVLGIAIFGYYIVYLLRLAKNNLESEWGVTLFVFMLISCVFMTTNNIFSGYQLMSIIVLLNIACVLHLRLKNENCNDEKISGCSSHLRTSPL